ncbi:MAG: bifunctional nicotinamidase/pyrazinamidase [Bacteroidales bacterium]|jgi:nicotinamidase/pyrazinamidase|nr:bifunctional nicotinamidase/pyrazinamidase [Bacteroidales bacterium]
MNALVIIDVQNDFMPYGSLGVPDGQSIVPVINKIQPYYDLVVATQDWHPQDHISFASKHPGKKPFDNIELAGSNQVLWPDHCVQGTEGAMFHPDLETRKLAAIFRKGMDPQVDSYSGFYDNRHLISTGLAGYLRDKGISDVHFCGLASDICVYFTIRDAVMEGFSATLVEDASRPLNAETFEILKKEMKGMGVKIYTSEYLNFVSE